MTAARDFVNKLLEDGGGMLPPRDPDDVDPQHYVDQAGELWSKELDEFTRGYIHALLFTCNDDNEEPLDKNYDESDLSPQFMFRIKTDCERFQKENAEDLAQTTSPKPSEWSAMEQAGSDFWLTRNGHGSGFWDAYNGVPYPDEVAERLDKAAHAYGSVDVYTVNEDPENVGVVIHAMQEAAEHGDFDPERYLDQLTPDEVASTRENAELRKRGFRFDPTAPSLHWRLILPRDGYDEEWVFMPPHLRTGKLIWRLLHYAPNDASMKKGVFDELLATFDAKPVDLPEAVDPENPEQTIDDLKPFLVLGQLIQDVAGNEIYFADRTSDNQHVGTLYCDLNRYGYWGWNEFYPEYFGYEAKDFQQHNHSTAQQALAAGAHWLQQKGTLRPGGPSAAMESEDDPLDGVNPQRYVDWVGKRYALGRLVDLHFGFLIGTTNEGTLEDNAQERGININDPVIKNALTDDFRQLELNALRILSKWFLVSDEGHADADLACSAWVAQGSHAHKTQEARKLLKELADNSEPVSTSKGDWESYFGRGSHAELYKGVSDYGQSLIDVYVDLLEREKVSEWFEYHFSESGPRKLRVWEAEDVDPEHYLRTAKRPAFCQDCKANLTRPNSVWRTYWPTNVAEAGEDPLPVKGHFEHGQFRQDDKTYVAPDHWGLANDSDQCAACNGLNLVTEAEEPSEEEVQRYIDSFEHIDDFRHDLTNFGFGTANRIDVWGRWVIFNGTTYWAEIDGRPSTEEDFRRLGAEFCRKHYAADYKLKLTVDSMGQAYNNPRWFWYQLAVPKAIFTDESLHQYAMWSQDRFAQAPEVPYANYPEIAGPVPPELRAQVAYMQRFREGVEDLDDPEKFMKQDSVADSLTHDGYIPTRWKGSTYYAKAVPVNNSRVFILAREVVAIGANWLVFYGAWGDQLTDDGGSVGHAAKFRVLWANIAIAEVNKLVAEFQPRQPNPEYLAKEIIFNLVNTGENLEDKHRKRTMVRDGARRNNLPLPEAMSPEELDDPEAFLERDWKTILQNWGFDFGGISPTIGLKTLEPDYTGDVATIIVRMSGDEASRNIEFSTKSGRPGTPGLWLNWSVMVPYNWLSIVLGHLSKVIPRLKGKNAGSQAMKILDEIHQINYETNIRRTHESADPDDPESILSFDPFQALISAGYQIHGHKDVYKTWLADLVNHVFLEVYDYSSQVHENTVVFAVGVGVELGKHAFVGDVVVWADWMNIIIPMVDKFMEKRRGEPLDVGVELYHYIRDLTERIGTEALKKPKQEGRVEDAAATVVGLVLE